MKTTEQGRLAESEVANYLLNQSYEIADRNWRRRRCEIDIVAKKKGVVFFVEVKYRGNSAQGDGFEYITPTKLKQMRFAAETWVAHQNWSGDYRLMAASVSGVENLSIELLEL